MSSHSYIADPKNDDIFININGKLFQRSDAKISVFDSGFLLGDGVWEGIRLHKSKLVFIEEHIDRLFTSAKGISLDIPLSRENIIDELNKVLKEVNIVDRKLNKLDRSKMSLSNKIGDRFYAKYNILNEY